MPIIQHTSRRNFLRFWSPQDEIRFAKRPSAGRQLYFHQGVFARATSTSFFDPLQKCPGFIERQRGFLVQKMAVTAVRMPRSHSPGQQRFLYHGRLGSDLRIR